jgi:hypothetical protein
MIFSVPQYIDVEDKVAGPFTAKQLGWMFGMGATLLIFWSLFDTQTFWMLAIPTAMAFVALAFYRPHGRPLIAFIGSGIYFLFRPKVYVWRREVVPEGQLISKKEKDKMVDDKTEKTKEKLNVADLEGFAQVLDTEGMEKSARIEELLQKKNLSKK